MVVNRDREWIPTREQDCSQISMMAHTSPTPCARRVSLRDLLPNASFVDCADVITTSVRADSRKVRPGDLFACLPGLNTHGLDHADEAIRRGAVALLTEVPVFDLELPQCVVANARAAFAKVCYALANSPHRKLKCVGITGTNGKTTTCWMLRSILEASGQRAGLWGSVEYDLGGQRRLASLTTPEPDESAQLFSQMLANRCEWAVLELSSQGLHQQRVAGVELEAAGITGISHDHLDYHGDFAEYANAKAEIARLIKPNQDLIYNCDDRSREAFKTVLKSAQSTVGFSRAGRVGADFAVSIVDQTLDGTRIRVEAEGTPIIIDLKTIGELNVSNAACAISLARSLGIEWPAIQFGLSRFNGVPGRLERVRVVSNVHCFVDFAHTPDALEQTLASLRPLVPGRLICVFGAGGNRDGSKRPLMGRAVRRADSLFLTNDNPRNEDPLQILNQIRQGVRQHPEAVTIQPDRELAIHQAVRMTEPGDCLVIAGKGHETVQQIGPLSIPFNDKEIATQALLNRWQFSTSVPRSIPA